MGIVHIVLFEFKPTIQLTAVNDVCDRVLALKDKCVNPTTKKTYIKSVIGGRDNSIEGHQGGLSHAFIIEFENDEDRQYYVKEDPAHLALVASLGDVVQQARVVDFEPGKF